MNATDLAAIYHVSVRTIRRWAHDDHWQSHSRGNYRPADAHRSWQRRHNPRPRPPLDKCDTIGTVQ